MRQRGRKSSTNLVALNVTGRPPPIEPMSDDLPKAERELFDQIAQSVRHLVPSDALLLELYACTAVLARKTAQNPALIGSHERMTKLLITLATKLRLTPQSRSDPKTVGRQPSRPLRPLWD